MRIPKEQKSTGTLVALLLVVLGPALCVVWFMNVAMRNERLAVQQTLTDAYHNHLLSLLMVHPPPAPIKVSLLLNRIPPRRVSPSPHRMGGGLG